MRNHNQEKSEAGEENTAQFGLPRMKFFSCPDCSRKFAKEESLALHLRMHNQEKSEAGEETTAEVGLPGLKFFSCPDCSRKFAEEKSLALHLRMHDQEKSEEKFFSCPDCSKKFAEEKSLALHLRVYAGVKHFSCSLCLRSCVQLKHWETTMHIHTGEEKHFSCPQCTMSFNAVCLLKRHLKVVHNDEEPDKCSRCKKLDA
jgi:uncharacterized Zn-finger protein